ncbi:MAG TPA: hypothetical protein VF549_20940 [Solirubrobacteraceae bacterium]|jgi:hypothetical protein
MSLDASLAPLLGSWSGEEQLAATPWTTAGLAAATIEFTEAPAGAVLQRYRQVRDEQETLAGLGILDLSDGNIRHFWWDSLGQQPDGPAIGRATDGEIVVERTSARGTNRTRMVVDRDRLVYEVAFAPPGQEPQVVVSGRYRRA